MAYKLTENGFIDLDTGANIPFAPGNRHYTKAIQELTEAGLVSFDGDELVFNPDGKLLVSDEAPVAKKKTTKKKTAKKKTSKKG